MDAQNCVTRPVKGTGAGSAGEGKSVKDATSIRKKAAAKGNASEAAAIPWTVAHCVPETSMHLFAWVACVTYLSEGI